MELKIFFRNIIILFLVLLGLTLLDKVALAGDLPILINEVMFDPIGSDLGYEWIELYNPNDTDISLTNMKIQIAGTSFTDGPTISGLIPSQSFFTICELKVIGCNLYVSKLGFQNGGGATDGIQTIDSFGNVMDQVFYDRPNTNSLTNEKGIIVSDTQAATLGASGETLGRVDFIDTNNSFADFLIYSIPSLGAENIKEVEDGDTLPQTGDNILWVTIPFVVTSSFIISIFFGMLLHKLKLMYLSNDKDNKKENCKESLINN